MKKSPNTLVTGANGFLGRWLLIELTRRGHTVAALIRNAEQRGSELRTFLDTHGGNSERLTLVDGDLCKDGLGMKTSLPEVRDVFHLAAAFAFGMDPEHARATNVDGTQRVLAWAVAQSNLRRFVHLGGYRATHLPEYLKESPFPLPQTIRNRLYRELGAYEASKYESQLLVKVFAQEHQLPLTIVSPSGVIGDSSSGKTIQIAGLGEIVQKLYAGKLPALAGTKNTFLPVVAVDHLARMLASAPEHPETLGQELCVLDQHTPRLPELIDRISVHLGVQAPKHLVPTSLLRVIPKTLSGVEPESLSFLTEDRYDTRSAEEHARVAGISMPDFTTTLERWVTYLVASRFGDNHVPEPAEFRDAAGSRTFCVGNPAQAETVFLHGIPWNGDSWQAMARLMGTTSLRPDLPGLGRSSAARGGYLDWLEALLANRQEQVQLIGHSLGTEIAVRYAHAFPERVSSLVLISPYFLQGRPSWYLRQPVLTSRVFSCASAQSLQRQLLGEQQGMHPAFESAFAQLKRRGVATRNAQALAGAADAGRRQELQAMLNTIRVPTLLIHGEDDPWKEHLPSNHKVITVAGAGHSPHITNPKACVSAINDWLTTFSISTNKANKIPRPSPTFFSVSQLDKRPTHTPCQNYAIVDKVDGGKEICLVFQVVNLEYQTIYPRKRLTFLQTG
jgi:pimeloyl-ACP methyl ester carboxylesterase/nucleoside-diphosphate-sugar epimerase